MKDPTMTAEAVEELVDHAVHTTTATFEQVLHEALREQSSRTHAACIEALRAVPEHELVDILFGAYCSDPTAFIECSVRAFRARLIAALEVD